MSAPGQPGYPGTYYRSPWYISRFIMFLAFLCFAIAALIAGGIVSGPALAWFYGGFAAVALSWAAP
jgi:hypothetical protein